VKCVKGKKTPSKVAAGESRHSGWVDGCVCVLGWNRGENGYVRIKQVEMKCVCGRIPIACD
jgi:hypothetical protein